MEFEFLHWAALRIFAAIAIIGGFGWYFYTYYKKHENLPKSKVPYIAILIIVVVYSFGLVKTNPPEVQQRTIKTYDTAEVYNIPEIELQTKQIYKPKMENQQ